MKYGRDLLKDVQGYMPGEQPTLPDIIKLNTNENPHPPSPKVTAALQAMSAEALRRYPDPVAVELREACAERYGFDSADWVVAGNGMDELLALAVRTFVDLGDTVLTTYPTYTLYETLAQLHGAEIREVDLDDNYQLTEEFFATPARLCFLPRPNAPSGVCARRADVERLCREFDGIVVIDEAYVDFSDDNCAGFPKRFENAIVMRTFSKAFSLAGVRLGVAFAQPAIISEFLKTKDSYNLSALTQAAGLAALADYGHMEANAAKVCATRARLTDALTDMGFEIPPSQANFVLARWHGTPDAGKIHKQLRQRNILVRYFDQDPRLLDALRITVGKNDEADLLLAALVEIVHDKKRTR